MSVVINGTTGITNDGGYTGDGVVFADTTPANTLVTTTGGNVGVGTSSPENLLQASTRFGVSSSGIVRWGQTVTVSGRANSGYLSWDTGLVVLGYEGAGAIRFDTNGTERARIDSSGNLLVGTTTDNIWTGSATNTGFKAEQSGTIVASRSGFAALLVKRTNASTGNMAEFAYGTSQVGAISTNGSNTTYSTSSDYRLKENIVPMTGALSRVAALKPCTYTWKATGETDEGFIAHELQEVCPGAVTGEKDAVNEDGTIKPQGIDTSFLVATLTAAIQEQQAIITAQAAQIQQLREKVLEVEEGTSNMLVENTNNLYETITALTARVAALEGK